MVVIRKHLHVSEEIMKKVSSGEYTICGGEVRDENGQIKKILRDAGNLETVLHYGIKYRKPLVTIGKLFFQKGKSLIKSK